MVERTDSREAKAVLGAASDHLLMAISQVDIAVLLSDASGNITYVNPHFTTLMGYAPVEIIGHSFERLRSKAHDRAFYHDLHAMLASGKVWTGRLSIRTRRGNDYEVRCVVSPLRDGAGAITGYSAFFRDAVDEMKLEAQLRQVQKLEAIGELAAGIAHEINTPIQYVGDNIQFFRDAMQDMIRLIEAYQGICEGARANRLDTSALDAADELRREIDWDYLRAEVPDAIDQAMEGRNRVAEIVRAMKEFAHPGDEILTPVDINHAVENTLSVSRNEWKYVAEIKTDFAPDLPPVPCYPGSFNQVLLNMVVNAAHAIVAKREGGGAEKGLITISTSHRDGVAELRIRDSGCGIPPEHRERIFEPFFTTKDIGKGTGQGLALAHTVIVDRMGGAIEVETEPGEGTTFCLKLPLCAAEPAGEICA